MNHCRNIEIELAAYAGGELGSAERKRVRSHLDGCAECRAELAREMNLRETLGALPTANVPADLDDRIRAAIQPAGNGIPSRRYRHRLAAALTVAAAGLALALILPALRPAAVPEPIAVGPRRTWTHEEITAAREEVMFSLALTARVLDRTQKDAVIEVFANQLPHLVNRSLKFVKPTTSGGNG
jgi:anti-sigma factor RsiW